MEAANLQNPLNEQLQQQQQQLINEDEEQVQQQQQFIEDQEQEDFGNYGEQRGSDEEEEENVSKRVYVLDEIDLHPLRCNLCPESIFTYPNGVKMHRKDKHGLHKFQCHCGFLYLTDQDRERHKSDRHPKAPKQKKCMPQETQESTLIISNNAGELGWILARNCVSTRVFTLPPEFHQIIIIIIRGLLLHYF